MMELNQIYLGDAYKLIKDIPDKSVDLIVTDPPYRIDGLNNAKGFIQDRDYLKQMREASLGDSIDLSILDEFVRVLKKINVYLFCNKEQIYDYLTYFVKERGCNWEMLIWAKTNPPPFVSGHYLKDKEYCLYFWEKGVELHPKYENAKTVYVSAINAEDKKLYGHPTIKPLDMIRTLIENSAPAGG